MRTLFVAHVSLLLHLAARRAQGKSAVVEQADLVLSEDGRSVVAYCYCGRHRDFDEFHVSWDLPAAVSEAEFEHQRTAMTGELLGHHDDDDEEFQREVAHWKQYIKQRCENVAIPTLT